MGTEPGEPQRDPAGRGTAQDERLGRTRTARTWTAAVLFVVILGLLLSFALQNDQEVTVSFLTFTFGLPLAAAMLLSAVAGAALVAIPGVLRVVQLRRAARRR